MLQDFSWHSISHSFSAIAEPIVTNRKHHNICSKPPSFWVSLHLQGACTDLE